MDTAETAEIKIEIVGAAAVVTLDRPRALNALTDAMRSRLREGLVAFARDPQVYCVVMRSTSPKAFSAGSDVREVTGWGKSDMERARRAFREEYALNWHCECFSKPTISLIDGMVMGGGVGVSLYGTHRVAGEGYRFAMPETLIGLFPDVGVCHALARMPGAIGMYLGLTGRTIGRADAYALGLATHCISAASFDAIEAELTAANPVDPVLDGLHADPGAGELPLRGEVIDHCFGAPTVEDICVRLDAVTGTHKDWATDVLADLRARAPISLKITHRHIRDAAALDLRQTLHIDYRLVCRVLEGHDFYEGVRAVVLEKTGAPAWSPSRIEDVTAVMVEAMFAPLGAGELTLPTRQEMQAARA